MTTFTSDELGQMGELIKIAQSYLPGMAWAVGAETEYHKDVKGAQVALKMGAKVEGNPLYFCSITVALDNHLSVISTLNFPGANAYNYHPEGYPFASDEDLLEVARPLEDNLASLAKVMLDFAKQVMNTGSAKSHNALTRVADEGPAADVP